ncbi:MAG: PAS domain S-box protein [Verrucomicrobiales bacterium]|nr:PAS domain S-box protein [Verrucomicrobiales bacterium]
MVPAALSVRPSQLLDIPSQGALDDLSSLAAQICSAPIAMVCSVEEDSSFCKSVFGGAFPERSERGPFCREAVNARGLFVVPDAREDPRFCDDPFVTGPPELRFYAGLPLYTASGDAIGTLCVFDVVPRELEGFQKEALEALGRQAIAQIDLGFKTRELSRNECLLFTVFNSGPESVHLIGPEGSVEMMNRAGLELFEAESFDRIKGKCIYSLVSPKQRSDYKLLAESVFQGEAGILEYEITGLKGTKLWLQTHSVPMRDENGLITGALGVTRDVTERRRTEEQLSHHRAILEETGRIANVGGWELDVDAGNVLWTGPVASIHGLDPDDIVNLKRGLDFYSETSRAEVEAAIERAIQEGEPFDLEAELTSADGVAKWVRMIGHPMVENGSVVKLRGSFQEITGLKRTESELRLRNQALENSLNGFDLVDENGKFIYVNKAYLKMWGYDSLDEVVGQSAMKHCVDPQIPVRLISELKEKGECTLEFTALRKNGSKFEASMAAQRIKDAGGREMFTGCSVDITERKRTETALKTSKEHLSSLIDSVEGIVWEADPETLRFTYVSPKAERLLGYSVSRWVEEESFWVDHIHPEDRTYAVDYCSKYTKAHQDHEFVYRMIAADGRTVWLRDIVTVVMQDDQVSSLRGIMVDITEQRNAEKRIRQLNRTHAVLSGINQLIVREKDVSTLLMETCRIAVEKGQFRMAWIGLLNRGGRQLRMAGHAGASDETLDTLKSVSCRVDRPPGCSFTAKSLSSGRHGICHDIATDPESVEWRVVAMGWGYRSLASLPLMEDGKVIGNFNLYSGEKGFFDEEEMILLDELAADISFALKVRKGEVERLEMERALRESKAKLSNSMKIARLSHWDYDTVEGLFKFNDHFYDLFRTTAVNEGGYSMSLGQVLQRFCHPEDVGKLESVVRKVSAARERDVAIQLEHRVVYGDEQVGHVAVQIFVVKDEEGRNIKIYGVNQDITEKKLAEQAMQEVEQRSRTLIEHSADCLTLVNDESQILYASPSVSSTEGYSLEELIGCRDTDNTHPDDLAMVAKVFEETLMHPGKPVPMSWRRKHKDGRWLWLEGVVTNLLDDPAVGAVVKNYRDVSSRKQLEEELRQSQKLEAIGQLAGGVAHDFNNILTIIHGYGSMLMMEDSSRDEIDESAQQIIQASERAANLTRQLLAFSRRQVMQPRRLDLNENVRGLSKMLKRIVGEDVNLNLSLDSSPLMTRADGGMLDQLLLNLVVNARDAMPEGGQLSIETAVRDLSEKAAAEIVDALPGSYALLRVTDTGTGISPEDMTRIFEPFFTTKEQGQGTGLGLATVFGIVKQHKGVLSVESEPGQTVFEILLPIVESVELAASGGERNSIPKGGSETILLVEDEAPVRSLARHILERAGYRVLEAAHGVEALEIWEEHQDAIQLLFTDIVMPGGVSGFELANRVREANPGIEIVFISGYSAEIAGKELALKEGQNFIQKPCSPRDLLKVIRQSLDERSVNVLCN